MYWLNGLFLEVMAMAMPCILSPSKPGEEGHVKAQPQIPGIYSTCIYHLFWLIHLAHTSMFSFFLPNKTTWEKHKIPKKNCSKKIFSKDGGFPPVHTLSPGEFEAPVHILYLNVIQPWRIMEPSQKIGVFPTTK